ncbi:MAG: peptidylprolyl isomerase [Pseudomonadales bacterium]|nr:peptidylprolyl isomerase [Pseudomonadales bacterium]
MKNILKNVGKKLFPSLLLAATIQAPALAPVQLLDQVVAIVDNDVVMLTELEERVEHIYRRLEESGTEAPPRAQLVPQVLERLITERLQISMGLRAGVRVSDAELNQAIANMAQSQNIGVEEFVERAHNSGLKLANLRRQIRNDILIQRVQDSQVGRRVRVTEQEVTNFLNSEEGRNFTSAEVNLGHIMLPLSAGSSRELVQEVQHKAAEILEQLNGGADFKQLAVTNSSGQNALSGGDLGWKKTAQLPGIFSDAVSNLKPGDVTPPLRSEAGIHLLKLYERRGGGEQLIEQSKVRHILIKTNEIRTDEDAKKILLDIKEQVLKGDDFAALAKAHSDDIASALQGGDVGWSLPGQFVPQFEQIMRQTAVNEMSEPFRSQFGWHLLQVTDRRSQDFSNDIKRKQAENILRNRKYEEELQVWLGEIRDEAYVEIKLGKN